MKFIMIATLLAVAAADPIIRTLTLRELSTAFETKQGDPNELRAIKYAINKIMNATFTGKNQESVLASVPSPSGKLEWTISEMNKTMSDPSTDKQIYVFVKMARDTILQMNAAGINRESMAITLPAMDISTWNLEDLVAAKEDPNSSPALQRRLQKAVTYLEKANASGKPQNSVTLVTTVGMIPNKNPRFIQTPKFILDELPKNKHS